MAILGLFAVCLTNSWCWRQAKSIGKCCPKVGKACILFGGGHFFHQNTWCFLLVMFFRISNTNGIHRHQTTIFFGNETSYGTFSKHRGKSKNMTPPNRWCGAQSSISQAESSFSAQSPAEWQKDVGKDRIGETFSPGFFEQIIMPASCRVVFDPLVRPNQPGSHMAPRILL